MEEELNFSYNHIYMYIVSIISIVLFFVTSAIHLITCFIENEKFRQITKCTTVIFLVIFAATTAPQCFLIYLGGLFGIIGDAILIKKERKDLFVIGCGSFLVGHFCYLIQILLLINNGILIPWFVYLLILVFLISLIFVLYPLTKKLAGRAALAGNFYMPLIGFCLMFSIILATLCYPTYAGVMVSIGYACFLISDSILIFVTFKKDIKRRDFYVMLTYLIAQMLIIVGLSIICSNI